MISITFFNINGYYYDRDSILNFEHLKVFSLNYKFKIKMCFTASASFGAGIILTTIGFATIKKAREPSQLFFASIPLLFGVQQFSEGFLWLALTFSKYAFLELFSTYIFLFFAQIIWPILIPTAIYFLEKKEKKAGCKSC